jgi:DNA-binding beta-propeller fold protein YncE
VPSDTVSPNGKISSSGLYTAPANSASAILQAISSADQNQTATAAVAVVALTPPAVTAIDPTKAAQGSVQQDVYLTGSNFFATTSVLVGGVALPTANVQVITTALLRATIPSAQLAQSGTIQVGVRDQEGNPASFVNLDVVPVRPALVSALPGSVPQNSASSPTVILTGGFFAPSATTATFNGQGVSATVTSSRQLSLAIGSGNLATPGLYPIVVTNSGLALGQPNTAALNLGVTPLPGSIPGSASATTVAVGASPSAVAIDETDGIAVVANTSDGSVSLISLTTPPTLIGTINNVGSQPTGIAVDDLLSHPIAVIVNSGDFTVSAIDLKAKALVGTALNVNIGPTSTSPVPLSIGINPLTHRALVAYRSTNQATVLDLSTGAPTIVQQVGGTGAVSFGTGANPEVGIDPRLNWAVVTPGGSGAVSLVDLGAAASAGQPNGRAPQVIASVAVSSFLQGIGIDPVAHEALAADPQNGTLTTFSLLNFGVMNVTSGGSQFVQKGLGAAAASPLENVGIAVSGSTPGASAAIVNLHDGTVLTTVGGFGSANLQAVAVDPASNQAVAVDQRNNQVYFISLGTGNPPLKPLQIIEASPAIIFGGASTGNTALTVIGSGFVAGSQVTLDGTPLATTFVSSRQLTATVPGGVGGMLGAPRNFAVQVLNPGNVVSNVTDLAVIVPVPVGKAPIGVSVDTDRDLAIVTNSGDGTVSLVTLTPQTPIGPTQAPAGSIQAIGPITVGTNPAGVAEIPRLGLALVANNGSNDATLVDVTQVSPPVRLCSGSTGCGNGPTGVAVNQDSASGVITDANVTSPTTPGGTTLVTGMTPATSSALPTATVATGPLVDHNPVAVAIDPNPPFVYAGVATNSSTSGIDFVDLSSGGTLVGRTSGLSNPTGIVFDPVNQVFLAANSLANGIVIVDPATFLPTPVTVGIGPTSLDYNFQTSTLVTVNSISHTMSVLSYVCPPTAAVPAPACLGPQVSTVIGLGGTQANAPVFGPNAVAVDPILSLAVLVDQDNNQVLLVPLPH